MGWGKEEGEGQGRQNKITIWNSVGLLKSEDRLKIMLLRACKLEYLDARKQMGSLYSLSSFFSARQHFERFNGVGDHEIEY